MLDARSGRFASLKYSEYYKKAALSVDRIGEREFGFGDFDNAIARRHVGFRNAKILGAYLAASAPASVSMSSAFYRYPEGKPMDRKGWLGSELVFDLDASDLRLPCQAKHGGSWVCSTCLDSIKQEVLKLIEDFLVPDFSIPKSMIEVNFSGNRGYHLHIRDERFYPLKSSERRQISDYITGHGINLKVFFPTLGERETNEESGRKKELPLKGPKPADAGWGGRLAKGMISALNGGEEKLVQLGTDRVNARRLIAKKAEMIMGITMGNWDKVSFAKKAEFWEGVLKGMTVKQTSSIDNNVTSGVEHLIRLPNTIHPSTGLLARKLRSAADLERFEPMREAVLFRTGMVKVKVDKAPEFSMGALTFGPYANGTHELPTYAALYLMLKRVAVLA